MSLETLGQGAVVHAILVEKEQGVRWQSWDHVVLHSARRVSPALVMVIV